jgi:predicted lipoprotein with Yx(FWY)xxD motif
VIRARLFLPGIVFALIAAACSSASKGGSPAGSTGTTIAVRKVAGVGNVYTNAAGMSLYSPMQEASGTILCTGPCTSIWIPLIAPAGAPTKSPGVRGSLSVVTRPDGTRQVTLDGAPLYRFFQDTAPGDVNGNGIMDSFGGTSFTWRLETSGRAAGGAHGGYGGGYGGYSP